MSIRHLALGILAASILLVGKLHAQAFTPGEKNDMMIAEIAAQTRSELMQVFGQTTDSLAVSGAFSDVAWTMSITGNYAGNPFNLAVTAALTPLTDTRTYTSVGTVGLDSWTGSGAFDFFDIIPGTLGMHFEMNENTTAAGGKAPDRELQDSSNPKKWVRQPDGSLKLEGSEFYKTEGGMVISGPHPQTAMGGLAPAGRAMMMTLPDDSTFAMIDFNTTTNTFSGTVTWIPEPSSAWLAVVGAGLIAARFRKGVA